MTFMARTKDKIFFAAWVIEAYKRKHGLTGEQTIILSSKNKINEWLFENFDVLHTVGTDYVISEIEDILKTAEKHD